MLSCKVNKVKEYPCDEEQVLYVSAEITELSNWNFKRNLKKIRLTNYIVKYS